MIRTQIQLTQAQAERLRALAAMDGVSMAEVIRRAVDAMARSSAMPDQAQRRQRAIAVIGRFASGHRDISSDHDRYLAEDLAS